MEIWHCDAGGTYSGFESGATGSPGGGPPPSGGAGPGGAGPGGAGPGGGDAASGETSDGSYSVGDAGATPSDDATFLRGAQATDARGVAQFTTIYPGWYSGRTVHVHMKVHVDKATVLTTQLYFDEALNDAVLATSPYSDHAGRDTTNDRDSIFDEAGLLDVSRRDDGYLGVINLGVQL